MLHSSPTTTTNNDGTSKSTDNDHQHDLDIIFPYEKNTHNSVLITINDNDDIYNKNARTFRTKLQTTITTIERHLHDKYSAIWIIVPISRARFIEEASQLGFEFHHAEGKYATLSKWLLTDETCRIPTYATHQVGVGAIVIHSSTKEILCVREKRNNYRPWKIPGGLVELGEELDEAVVREVFEETGIRSRFISILGVRHVHGVQFGRSDLYFLCRLEPILPSSEDHDDDDEVDEDGKIIPPPRPIPQEGEIESATWLPLNEYRAMVNSEDDKVGHPMMKQIMKLVDQGYENDMQKTVVSSVVPGRKPSPIYHVPIRQDELQLQQGRGGTLTLQ